MSWKRLATHFHSSHKRCHRHSEIVLCKRIRILLNWGNHRCKHFVSILIPRISLGTHSKESTFILHECGLNILASTIPSACELTNTPKLQRPLLIIHFPIPIRKMIKNQAYACENRTYYSLFGISLILKCDALGNTYFENSKILRFSRLLTTGLNNPIREFKVNIPPRIYTILG